MAVAHLALDLGARHQSRDRIDHQHVDRIRAHQCVDDLQRLLASVGLRHDQFVDIDSELLGIARVERMLGIDKCGGSADLLGLGDGVQRQRRLARAFGPVNLDHPATRETADPERDVEPEAAARDGLDFHLLARPELHCRALAERAINLGKRRFERLLPIHSGSFQSAADNLELRCHVPCLRSSINQRRPSPASGESPVPHMFNENKS